MNGKASPPIAISAAFWGNPTGTRLSPWLADVREMGFEGVTLFVDFWVWGDSLGDGSAVGAALADADLGLASIVTSVHDDLDRYRRLVDLVAQLGCRHLVVIGGTGSGARPLARLAAQLDRIGRIATQAEVSASYHHHTDTTGQSFADVSTLLDRTDPDLVGLTFDAGHAAKDFIDLPIDGRVGQAFEALWPRIHIVELKDWRPDSDLDTPVGDGVANAAALLSLMRVRGYTDWTIVEQNDDLGRTDQSKRECAMRSLAFIRSRERSVSPIAQAGERPR